MADLFYIGRGTSSWRDPRNWSRVSGGRPLRRLHARGTDRVVVEGSGVLDLRGMPYASIEISGFEGRLRLPDGRRVNLLPPSRPLRLWRRLVPGWTPRGAHAESWLGRTLRERGITWHDAVRLRSAAAVSAGQMRLWVVVPRIAGGVSTWFAVGGSFVWDDTATANWSTTSGGPGGAGVPGVGDVVNLNGGTGPLGTVVTYTGSKTFGSVLLSSAFVGSLLCNAGLNCSGTITFNGGALNTNGQSCSWGSYVSALVATAKTLTMGASAIAVTGTWSDVSSLAVPANTAVVTLSGASASFSGAAGDYGGMSLVFSGSGTATIAGGTLGALTRAGTAATTDGFTLSANVVVTGACTFGGQTVQGINRVLVASSTIGTQRTLTAASYVIAGDSDFTDINLAYSGAPSWTNAGGAYIGDGLGNAGAVTTNATPSVAQTQSSAASFSWSSAAWTTRVPLPQDDVTVTGNGSGKTITVNMPRIGRSITFTCTGGPTLTVANAAFFYGSFALAAAMTITTTANTVSPAGRSAQTFTTAGVTVACRFQFSGPTGSYTLQDNYNGGTSATAQQLSHIAGSLVDNGKTVTVSNFVSTGAITRSLTASGTWNIVGTGVRTVWNVTPSLVVAATGSTINVTATDGGTKTFTSGGQTYGVFQYTSAGSAGLTVTGSSTFSTLNLGCSTARTITLPAGGVQNVSSVLTLAGTSGHLLSLVSSSPGTRTTIGMTAGVTYTNQFTSVSADVVIGTNVLSTATAPVEAQMSLSGTSSAPVEATGSVAAAAAEPVEALMAVLHSLALPAEATGAAAAAAAEPVEALQELPPTSALAPLEALRGLAPEQVAVALEALQSVAEESELPWEARGAPAHGRTRGATAPVGATTGGTTRIGATTGGPRDA